MADLNTIHNDLKEVLAAIHKSGGQSSTTPGHQGASKTVKEGLAQKATRMLAGANKVVGAGSVGGMASAGMSSLGAAGGPWGMAAMAAKDFVVSMAQLPNKIKAFAEGLHQANRQFANASPAMAMVMMQSDFQDLMRDMRKGNTIAGSAAGLAEGRNKLLNQMEPAETGFQNLQNRAGELASTAMSAFLEKSGWGKQAGKLFDALGEMLEEGTNKIQGGKTMVPEDEWLKDLEKLEWEEDNKRAKRAMPVRVVAARDPQPKNAVEPLGAPGGFAGPGL